MSRTRLSAREILSNFHVDGIMGRAYWLTRVAGFSSLLPKEKGLLLGFASGWNLGTLKLFSAGASNHDQCLLSFNSSSII